jgi:3-dehydroquinate synthetase
LPTQVPAGLNPTAAISSMLGDKKNRGDQIHFALPAKVGGMHRGTGWTTAVAASAIERVLTGPSGDRFES